MSSHVIEDLTSSILDFQANEVRIILRRKHEAVDVLENEDHFNNLRIVWQLSKLEEESDSESGTLRKWRKLGFETEEISQEFANVGMLGLDCLVSFILQYFVYKMWQLISDLFTQKHFAEVDPDAFAKVGGFALEKVPC